MMLNIVVVWDAHFYGVKVLGGVPLVSLENDAGCVFGAAHALFIVFLTKGGVNLDLRHV